MVRVIYRRTSDAEASLPLCFARMMQWLSGLIWQMSLGTTKPAHWPVSPANTYTSMGNRTVWSESSLIAGRSDGSLTIHKAPSADSNQNARICRLIWVFSGSTGHVVGFVVPRLNSRFYRLMDGLSSFDFLGKSVVTHGPFFENKNKQKNIRPNQYKDGYCQQRQSERKC